MKDQAFKQVYALSVLVITILWGVFAVCMTWRALQFKGDMDIMGAAGADVLLGSLIVWTGNTNQFFFRKSPKQGKIE